ncbi:unnamed protein product [Amaranthus hypochondriacus]
MDLSLLHSDISFNVLSRFPANILIQLKLVSKGWLRVIEDPDLMLYWQMKMGNQSSVSGFFFQEKFMFCDIDVQKLSYIPTRAKETRIYHTTLDFLPEKVTILGSSNGLICCRTCFPSPDPSIYICNPANKQWMNVKWDRISSRNYIAFSYEPSIASPSNSSTGYKLVRVFQVDEITREREDFYFTFEIYDWERRIWVKSKESCYSENLLCINKQITVKGILYWLTDDDTILMFDIENELSLLITLPISFTAEAKIPEICLGESDGELQCIVLSEEALLVWALEDSFTSKWDLRSFISFKVMEKENQHYLCNLGERVLASVGKKFPWMQPLAFKDGVLFLRVSNSAYSFDLNTRKMHLLCNMLELGHGSISDPIVIPYSVSLVPVANS